ncbi:hypothetical protein [Klenkia terrae]|jgi:hypothetical protein|uniref:Uncharacterized protein n=1 Tax=Klenkia terrae TaxID=1052259 RepID=A0ABU8EB62_9ACTN|nr:hypothetical protein [Klenkia terrae]SSC25748.1 Hypothetical protein KLENKIAIHU_4372 [Klenkia terrae]
MTTPQDAGTSRQRPRPDPLAMSPAEKVAAEWEARHDAAARGHSGSAGAVQHYLAESRAREAQRGGSGSAAHASTPPHSPAPVDPASSTPPPARRRRWWPFGRAR